MSSEMLTTKEVGEIMGVHFSTVGRWIDSGKLKGIITPGGHRRIREKDLVQYFKSKQIPVPEELQHKDKDKLRILVVEDDESVLDVLAAGLQQADKNYAVETATDGFEAGQILERFEPDIVVLDIFIPAINGYKICSMIKENYPGIKVITITGNGSEEVQEKIFKAGADAYIEKPFDIGDLAGIVQEFGGGRVAGGAGS